MRDEVPLASPWPLPSTLGPKESGGLTVGGYQRISLTVLLSFVPQLHVGSITG